MLLHFMQHAAKANAARCKHKRSAVHCLLHRAASFWGYCCSIAKARIRGWEDVTPSEEPCCFGIARTRLLYPRNLIRNSPSSVELSAMDNTSAGLVGGKHQHLGYLHMLGSLYGIERHIGHIVSCKRLDALINPVGTVLVAVKAHP